MFDQLKDPLFRQSLRFMRKDLGDENAQRAIDSAIFKTIQMEPNRPWIIGFHFAIWALGQQIPLTYLLGVRPATKQQFEAVKGMHDKHDIHVEINPRKVTRSKKAIPHVALRYIIDEVYFRQPRLGDSPNWDKSRIQTSGIDLIMTPHGPKPNSGVLFHLLIWEKYYMLLLIEQELKNYSFRSDIITSLKTKMVRS